MSKDIVVDDLINEGQVISDSKRDAHIQREYPDPFEIDKKDRDSRDAFERDYARIVHSASFRRLQGKMQLLGTQNSDYYRTRLTHSLEVSQIGQEIASKIVYQNERPVSRALVAAACIAHDLGNPPFGHFGEKVLNELMENHGGFEGNAQTLRIVCDLERKSRLYPGLNLTAATRLALVKYNITAKQKASSSSILDGKFIYTQHAPMMNRIEGLSAQTIECQIMELSDDIAYACHDLEDSLKSGVMTLDSVLEYLKNNNIDTTNLEDWINHARRHAATSTGDVFHKSITSVLIHHFVNDIGIVPYTEKQRGKKGTQNDKGLGFANHDDLLNGLKGAVYNLLVAVPNVAEYEVKGAIAIRKLFSMLTDTTYNDNNRFFPPEFQEMIRERLDKWRQDLELKEYESFGQVKDLVLHRSACDYIAGMTDKYAMQLYKQHFGKDFPNYEDSANYHTSR